jgi:MFS family permease
MPLQRRDRDAPETPGAPAEGRVDRPPARWYGRGVRNVAPESPQREASAAAPPATKISPWPYRFLWASSVLNQAGFWTQQVGVGWLILELTSSSFQIGVASFMRGLPMFTLGALGGVLVDRFDRRRMVLLSQTIAGVCALLTALLITLHWVQPWHVYVLVFISGACITINFPARQAMIPHVVPPGQVGPAVASIAAGQNGARVVSPGVAGALISLVGTEAAFYVQAAVFAAALALTGRLPTLPRPAASGQSLLGNMLAGFEHIRTTPRLRGLLLLALGPTVLAVPYQQLLPVFARDVYGIGAAGLGMLLTAASVGAFVGALVTTWLLALPRRGLILPAASLVMGAGLVVLPLVPAVPLALAVLFIVGAAISAFNSTTNALIHEATTDAYRGRVMSVYLVTWSLMPIGVLPLGALADRIGAPPTVALAGTLCALVVTGGWLASPALRALR